MLSVRAIYDGKNFQLLQPVPAKKPRQVIITFLEEEETEVSPKESFVTGEETLEERFEALFQQWWAETGFLSNGNAILSHPAYSKIIDLGRPAIPLILNKLKENSYQLFYALFKITGENPVPEKFAGYPREMAEYWLKWGKERGVIA